MIEPARQKAVLILEKENFFNLKIPVPLVRINKDHGRVEIECPHQNTKLALFSFASMPFEQFCHNEAKRNLKVVSSYNGLDSHLGQVLHMAEQYGQFTFTLVSFILDKRDNVSHSY